MYIAGAFLLGIGIVAGATYVRPVPESNTGAIIEATGNTEVVRSYIPPTDDDGDGVSDWEVSVDGIVQDVAKDTPALDLGAATDGTLTDSFSRSFFEEYLHRNINGTLSEEETANFLRTRVARVELDARDKLYGKKDIVLGENTDTAKRAYGNSIAAIINSRTAAEAEYELDLFQRVIQLDDTDALLQLRAIEDGYEAVLKDMLLVPVPPDYVGTHLVIINTYQALAHNVGAMVDADRDALYALLRFERHPDDSAALYENMTRLYDRLYRNGVRYANDEPAATFTAYVR